MKYLYFAFILSVLLMSECKKTEILDKDEYGIIIRLPHIWKTPLSEGDRISSWFDNTEVFDGEILLPFEGESNEGYFAKLNIETGEEIEKLKYFGDKDFLIHKSYFSNDNKLVIIDEWENYCIDLYELDYLWKFDIEKLMTYPLSLTSGISDYFFICGIPRGMSDTILPYRCGYVGDVNTGELELFLVPDLGDLPEPDPNEIADLIVGVDWIEPFYSDNELYLLVYYGKQYESVNGKVSQSFLGLYNFTKKSWVYERNPLGRVSWIDGKPILEDGRVYHTLYSHVECRNVFTGDIIWRATDSVSHNPNGFCISEDNIIVFEEGFNKKVTAYSKSDGLEIWSTASHGSISVMNELNNVVYFSSIGDGRLHALDANTGEYLWRLISPDKDKYPGGHFKTECVVAPGENDEKGRVIVSTFYSAICYEAIR